MKKICMNDFLTDLEIKKVMKLKKAKLICEEIIKPNLDRINKKLGQENDAMYLAYACEYTVSKTEGLEVEQFVTGSFSKH